MALSVRSMDTHVSFWLSAQTLTWTPPPAPCQGCLLKDRAWQGHRLLLKSETPVHAGPACTYLLLWEVGNKYAGLCWGLQVKWSRQESQILKQQTKRLSPVWPIDLSQHLTHPGIAGLGRLHVTHYCNPLDPVPLVQLFCTVTIGGFFSFFPCWHDFWGSVIDELSE